MEAVKDMPKLESPFVRAENDKGEYVVTPQVAEGMDWVFTDDGVLATEKLHGTNVSIVIENGMIASVWNRTERLPFFNKGKQHIIQGVIEAYSRGYCDLPDGQWFGELIGEKVNGNPYGITGHLWLPFDKYCKTHLAYKSWGKYPKDFGAISDWFKGLQPLYCWKLRGQSEQPQFVEGVVFHHPDGRMAKLRKDMFSWHDGKRHNT